MTKAIEKIIREKTAQMVKESNPYKDVSTKFFKGNEPLFLHPCGISYTESEIDDAYAKTVSKDMTNGFNERMVGYYDKWYRYNRIDEGRAYDAGVQLAAQQSKCPEELIIIPCN